VIPEFLRNAILKSIGGYTLKDNTISSPKGEKKDNTQISTKEIGVNPTSVDNTEKEDKPSSTKQVGEVDPNDSTTWEDDKDHERIFKVKIQQCTQCTKADMTYCDQCEKHCRLDGPCECDMEQEMIALVNKGDQKENE
jgi:hypothetical protein